MKKHENGFSLLEVTIAMAVMGFITLVSMTLMKNQSGQEAILRYKHDVAMKMLEVKRILTVPDRCTQILGGKAYSAAGTSVTGGIAYSVDQPILLVQRYDSFEVTSINLRTGTFSSSFDLVINVRPNASGLVSRFFSSSRANHEEVISIVGTRPNTASGVITNCGPIVSATNNLAKQTLCTTIRYTDPNGGFAAASWNAGTSTCTFDNVRLVCPNPWDIPIRLERFGKLGCAPIYNHLDYNRVFDMTPATCPSKQYALHVQNTGPAAQRGKIGIGCKPPGQRAQNGLPLLQ